MCSTQRLLLFSFSSFFKFLLKIQSSQKNSSALEVATYRIIRSIHAYMFM